MAKDKNDSMTIRAGSEEKKEDFKQRCKKLKSNGITQAKIFEDGLFMNEKQKTPTEEYLINKRAMVIAERDEAIKNVIAKNKLIEAYNRQLKDKYSNRYKEYTPTTDVRILYDSEGNEMYY